MELFSIDEVCELSGLDRPNFQHWLEDAILVPQYLGGKGRGNGTRFSKGQTIGLLVAGELRRSERGCKPPYIARLTRAFTEVSEDWLLKRFANRRTHFAAIDSQGYPVLLEPEVYWVDLESLLERLEGHLRKRKPRKEKHSQSRP